MLEDKLITGVDIDLSNYRLGIIHQPTIRELASLPYDSLEFISPYVLLEQNYKLLQDKGDISRFELIQILEPLSLNLISEEYKKDCEKLPYNTLIKMKLRYSFIQKLIITLTILYQCSEDEIQMIKDENELLTEIYIKDKAFLDKENFDLFIKIIFKMFLLDVNKVQIEDEEEWIEHSGSEREKRLIAKFKEKRRLKKEKERLYLCDYINMVATESNYSYLDLLDWTYYQLMNKYRANIYIHRTSFEEDIYTSCQTTMKGEDIFNWQKSIKIEIDKSII